MDGEDKSGELHAFSCEPDREAFPWTELEPNIFACHDDADYLICLDETEFPEVTWENSPQQVELKFITNKE